MACQVLTVLTESFLNFSNKHVFYVSAFSIQSYWKAPRVAGPFSLLKKQKGICREATKNRIFFVISGSLHVSRATSHEKIRKIWGRDLFLKGHRRKSGKSEAVTFFFFCGGTAERNVFSEKLFLKIIELFLNLTYLRHAQLRHKNTFLFTNLNEFSEMPAKISRMFSSVGYLSGNKLGARKIIKNHALKAAINLKTFFENEFLKWLSEK